MPVGATRRLKDPAELTPYELKLLELRKLGLTYVQMTKELDGKSNPQSIASRFRVIREKMELAESLNER